MLPPSPESGVRRATVFVDSTDSDPDLFISMAFYDDFASEHAARCSTAKFKVGRRQLKGNVFDMVLVNPEDQLILPC